MTQPHRPRDAVFRGYLVRTDEEMQEPCRVRVEVPRTIGGPKTISELQPPEGLSFSWGYPGGVGPQVTANALLSSAIGYSIGGDGTPSEMSLAFCEDVIARIPRDEGWTMPRQTVLWWVRGYYIGRGIEVPPMEALDLPPTVLPDE